VTATSAWAGPIPRPSAVSQPYWDGAKQHRLVIQRSQKTGAYVFYPRAVSPFGADDTLEWVEVSGRGHVHACAIARTPTAAHLGVDGPYVIAIVQLEEGPHMTANIIDCDPETIHPGTPVEAAYIPITEEITLVQFRPAAVG